MTVQKEFIITLVLHHASLRQPSTVFEKSLHAALKAWYTRPGDRLEARVSDYVIDIVRDGVLIEIQTRNFAAIKPKLTRLIENHPVRLVYPVAQEKWIIRQTTSSVPISRRKSPKKGCPFDIFNEMTSLSGLVPHNNLTIEVLLTRQEEILRDDGRGSWRRHGWSIHDRRLLEVLSSITLQSADDFSGLLPAGLPQPFTNHELAAALHRRVTLARRMTYTLCKIGCIEMVGKAGNARLYKS